MDPAIVELNAAPQADDGRKEEKSKHKKSKHKKHKKHKRRRSRTRSRTPGASSDDEAGAAAQNGAQPPAAVLEEEGQPQGEDAPPLPPPEPLAGAAKPAAASAAATAAAGGEDAEEGELPDQRPAGVGDAAGKVAEDVEPRRCEGKHLDVWQPIAPTQAGSGGSVTQLPRVWLPTLLYRAGALLQTVPLPHPLPISLLWQAPSLQQCSRTSRPRQVSGPPPQPFTLSAQRCVWARRPTISRRPRTLPRRWAAGEGEGAGQQPAAQQVCWPPPQQQVPASAGC